MPDEQMRALKDLLSAEAAPPDPTSPLPRPTGTSRGGLSALIADAPAPEPSADTPAAPLVGPTQPPASSAPRQRPPSTRRPAQAPPRDQVDDPPSPRRKTSITLPPSVRERVADAYHRGRWTLLALLELCGERLTSGRIGRPEIEAVIAEHTSDGGASAIRSLTVPGSLLDQFDELSTRWRLSRSSLVAACLVLVLDDLPD